MSETHSISVKIGRLPNSAAEWELLGSIVGPNANWRAPYVECGGNRGRDKRNDCRSAREQFSPVEE
jgi:hypothetical protein